MSVPATPADARALIIERLVGDTGEPDQVMSTARALAERTLPAILASLQDMLGTAVAVDIADIDLSRIADAVPEVESHAMSVIASASSPDALILSADAMAISHLVDVMFGGNPEQDPVAIERPLSSLEVDVATTMFDRIAQAMDEAAANAFAFDLPPMTALTGTEMTRHILRDGPAVRIALGIGAAGKGGRIVLTMPQRVLLRHRGGAQGGDAGEATGPEWRARFSEEVMRSTVRLEATMPLAKLSLADIAGFMPGQVIELEKTAGVQARLTARDRTLFVCEFGKLGQNYTVRIRHPFDADQDFIDGVVSK